MTTLSDSRDYFFDLTAAMRELLSGDEIFTCHLRAEDSAFVRFNRGRINQAGDVRQLQLDVDLIRGKRHAIGQVTLSGDRASDWPRLRDLIADLRELAAASPEDPYLTFNTDVSASGEHSSASSLPRSEEVLEVVHDGGGGSDLVGIYAAGSIQSGFASSFGQRNWHDSKSFNFDWSVFDERGRAVKASYAGFDWSAAGLRARLEAATEDLHLLAQPARALRPGKYRIYLAPAALHELLSLLSWGGFGLRGRMTRISPLLRLHEGAAELAAAIELTDEIAAGAAPRFEASGFPRPERVPLISGGRAASCLVSPRSALEYGVETNGAGDDEAPLALDLAAGSLDADAIARELHTGLIVSNLWYLNFSDRTACRTTGMTRFATLWIEGGKVVGPVDPMRFDDSVYRVLGDHLVGLTRQREWIMDPSSYDWRSTRTARLPGALVDDFTLTL